MQTEEKEVMASEKQEQKVERSFLQTGGTQTNNGNISFGDHAINIIIHLYENGNKSQLREVIEGLTQETTREKEYYTIPKKKCTDEHIDTLLKYAEMGVLYIRFEDATLAVYKLESDAKVNNLIIPSTLKGHQITSIYQNALSFGRFSNITIPNSVTSIGDNAISNCMCLASVTFANNSQLVSIGEWAFSNCVHLTSVGIPSSVRSIGSFAFFGCRRLACVTIGDSVRSIGSGAFDACGNLSSIIYAGTKAEWKAIEKGFCMTSFSVHCSDGEIAYEP